MDGREPQRLSASQPPNVAVGPSSYGAGAGATTNSSIVTPDSGGMFQGMRLSFLPMTSSEPKQVDVTGSLYQGGDLSAVRQGGVFNLDEPMKKKRGRPRKYGPDGSMSLGLTPSSASGYSNSPGSDPTAKRRGRPPGSGKKQQLDALGTPGIGFTPHVISVKVGEDIASKIMSFSQQGPRSVCILSANGDISDVTLRQPAISGGTVTYQGRYEIISLSGSFLLTEEGGTRSRSGGLTVALAGSNGRILGGGVAGMLVAATPVQVVVGSFIAGGKKPKPESIRKEPSPPPPQILGFGAPIAASPPSEGGTSSESHDGPGSPTNETGGSGCNNSAQQHLQAVYPSLSWSNSANYFTHD
ncbi:AT-hook motif nuclear-localized protein 10-like [Zingiber officinale]|uniref:AT-hook motif nuclear-localized protein 10-like n=1 Tax=Zingiber officinale TaxID=94328 RepID=UPI001C4ACCC3|nr:AT-hook motif nuclear-localized protein 10-like [Zingiber officinale]